MTKIPDAALEAGKKTFLAGEENVMTSFEQDITAAFLAMLEAWPGARERPYWDLMSNTRHIEIVLPEA